MSSCDNSRVFTDLVTHDGPLDNFRMETGHQKDNCVVGGGILS